LKFTATPSGTDDAADFVIVVNKVQELVLPELTEEWVQDNTDAPSIEALVADQRDRIQQVKLNEARRLVVDRTTSALAGLVDEDPPDTLVGAEYRSRAENTVNSLSQQGIPLEQFLAITGQDQDTFVEGLREASVRAVKVDLGLRAVADAEQMEVTDDDLEVEYARIAVQVREKPVAVRRAYERNDAVAGLRAEIRKSKALRWLLDRVEIVDTEGKTIDRALLLGESDDAIQEAGPETTEESSAE
jgi:trigger factor